MKAISIKQPWASLIVEGIKPVENRTRPWKHKGPLAIHASKTFTHYFPKWLLNTNERAANVVEESKLLRGGIIGSVNMVDCVTSHDSEFFFGPYGYVFEDPKKCDLIPWKGKQGVMNVNLYAQGFNELLGQWASYWDCTGCGNMLDEYPLNKRCPKCNDFILPF
jgi:hypothetical protein